MKKPYLSQQQRLMIRAGTLIGDSAMFNLRLQQFLRGVGLFGRLFFYIKYKILKHPIIEVKYKEKTINRKQ